AHGVIMGHESVGEVAEIGVDVTNLAVGDRVIVNPTLYCGRCGPCLDERTNFCLNKVGTEVGIDRDGSYADYLVLEDRFLHRIPDGVRTGPPRPGSLRTSRLGRCLPRCRPC